MADIRKLNHVAVVVPDIEAALAFWRDGLGLRPSGTKDVPAQKSRIAFLPVDGAEIELVQPTDDGSGPAKFLSRRGPGLHHICLETPDLDGLIARLKAKGVRLTSDAPQAGADGRRMIFVHPESAGGVLVELYESGEFAEKP
jgi:methylmalonyl-CoA/ethylmalonyl-CoA epimerase